jgi:hypothetical protein
MMGRLISLTSILLLCSTVQATMMLPLDLRALTARADRVVLGTVESQTSRWTPGHDAIYTEVTLRVARSYKGAAHPGDALVVRREGGSVDGIGMRVYGAASFEVGEEALVFVEQRGAASWVVGMAQGKLRVSTVDGHKLVSANLAEVAFLRAGETAAPGPRALAEVEREIRAHVRELERSGR